MLFYLDPPYWGCETDYGADAFCRADFERLARQLGGARGKFLLSLNDNPGVRECFSAFHIQSAETTYSISTAHGGAKKVGEVIISNFVAE
jgi:DNA adenine methylase